MHLTLTRVSYLSTLKSNKENGNIVNEELDEEGSDDNSENNKEKSSGPLKLSNLGKSSYYHNQASSPSRGIEKMEPYSEKGKFIQRSPLPKSNILETPLESKMIKAKTENKNVEKGKKRNFLFLILGLLYLFFLILVLYFLLLLHLQQVLFLVFLPPF